MNIKLVDLIRKKKKEITNSQFKITKNAIKLSEAYEKAPEEIGWYRLLLNNKTMYVGKAESGLRKRLSEHYNKKDPITRSEKKIYYHKNQLYVVCKTCDNREKCKEMEKMWIKLLNPPWNERVG